MAAVEVEILRLLIVFGAEGDISIHLLNISPILLSNEAWLWSIWSWRSLVLFSFLEHGLQTKCGKSPRGNVSATARRPQFLSLNRLLLWSFSHTIAHTLHNLSQQSKETFLAFVFETWLKRETTESSDIPLSPCLSNFVTMTIKNSLTPPFQQIFFTTQILGGHVTSRNQGLSSNDHGRQRRETLGTR